MRPKPPSANYRLIAFVIFGAAVIDVILAVTLTAEGVMYPLLVSAVVMAAIGSFILLRSR